MRCLNEETRENELHDSILEQTEAKVQGWLTHQDLTSFQILLIPSLTQATALLFWMKILISHISQLEDDSKRKDWEGKQRNEDQHAHQNSIALCEFFFLFSLHSCSRR